MILENIPILDITESHLKSLQDGAVEEGRIIEYKQFFGSTSDGTPLYEYSSLREESKKEFLADVSSFANAGGGHLLIGVTEANRVPVAVDGIPLSNIDRAIHAAEQAIQAGIEPELRGLEIRAIPLENSNYVLLFRIKESFSKPHWVRFGGEINSGLEIILASILLGITNYEIPLLRRQLFLKRLRLSDRLGWQK